jgi:hypothetical protein
MSPTIVAPAESLTHLQDILDRTRQGRRLQRLFHTHEREVWALAAVHPDLRVHLADAAAGLATAAETGELAPTAARAASQVLCDLNRFGTGELRHTVSVLQDELPLPRGGSMVDLIGD